MGLSLANRKALEYSGAKLAVAELYGAVDYGEPQRVAGTLGQRDARAAFETGVARAYELERTPTDLVVYADAKPWVKEFYAQLCREACV